MASIHQTRVRAISLVAFLALVCVVAFVVVPRIAAVGPLLWLNPADVDIDLGGSENVIVQLDNITNVYGAQFSLSFDPTVLEVVDADGGTPGVQISTGTCPAPDFVVTNTTDNTGGTVDYAATQLNPTPACDGGDVATVEFSCVATGETDVVTFTDSIISDPDGLPIAHTTQSTTIHCQGAPVELTKNGFFDVFVPNWWRGNLLTSADGPDCTTAATGLCSMKMVGNGDQKQLLFIIPKSGSAGDDFTFSLWNRAENSDRPFFAKVVLVYTDATQENFRLIPAKGTHGWVQYQLDFSAAKNFNRIRIFLVYGHTSGTVWFDDVSLTTY
jgi:hypothetical protein